MAAHLRRERWAHTAAVMALLANCHRDPKQHPLPYTPEDFDPTAGRSSRRPHKPDPAIARLLAQLHTGKRLPRPPGRWDRALALITQQEAPRHDHAEEAQ